MKHNHNAIVDVAQAAAAYTQSYFQQVEQPVQWTVPLDENHQLGMIGNTHDGSVVLTVWRQTVNDRQDHALMRATFDSRFGAGLVGGISTAFGHSLSVPLYAASEAHALAAAVDYLRRELDRVAWPASAGTPVMPALAGDARSLSGDARQAERDLARLADACGLGTLPAGARQFDLLFDDLPGRITLHPSNCLLLADFFLYDAAVLQGPLRQAVSKSALLINQTALGGHACAVGMDSREFITSTGRILLDRLDDAIWPRWLQHQVTQARDTRDLVKRLSLEGAQISYTTTFIPEKSG